MNVRLLTLALAAAGLLSACGGGGGGSGGGSDTPSSGSSNSHVTLTGVASKGLMANADVKAHPVKSDGSVDLSTVLASTVTDSSGHYTLTFDAVKDQPYVIRVSAKADGSTTHLDEVSGSSQPLPAGFAMRSLLVPAASSSVTVSASVTPFSEMAVAAAEKAGGVTKANADQAVSTVTQLLGFNPIAVEPKTVAASASGSADEQKLAVMLTAVSKLASTGGLGCDSAATGGDKTKCVVDALAASASTTSIKLTSGSPGSTTDVSAALGGAVSAVLADPTVSTVVSPATLAAVTTNLACTSSCTAASSGTLATAIPAAKALFTEIKSDWSALFSRGDELGSGAVNVEAGKIKTAMNGVQVPAELLLKDLGAVLLGTDLFHAYKSGATTVNRRGSGPAPADGGSGAAFGYKAIGCTVYNGTDTSPATGVPATSAATAGSVGCSARYFITRSFAFAPDGSSTTTVTQWRHGFTLLPQTDGSFNYTARARRTVDVTSCPAGGGACTTTTTVNAGLPNDTAVYTGSLVPTLSGGRISAFTVTGTVPGAFKSGTNTLANDHHSWSFSGTTSSALDGVTDTSSSRTTSITGSLVAYSDASTPVGTLQVKTGTLAESDAVVTAGTKTDSVLSKVALDVLWTTSGAEAEGAFLADGMKVDRSGSSWAPSRVSFDGALRSISGGTATDVMAVNAVATSTGYAGYDSTQPDSASNFFTVTLTAKGTVSAPGRPALEFTFGASKPTNASDVQAASFQYRSLVAGAPKMVIAGTATRGADNTISYTLSEAASKLSIGWVGRPTARTKLYYDGTTEIGTLDSSTKALTFVDGSLMSLDIGL